MMMITMMIICDDEDDDDDYWWWRLRLRLRWRWIRLNCRVGGDDPHLLSPEQLPIRRCDRSPTRHCHAERHRSTEGCCSSRCWLCLLCYTLSNHSHSQPTPTPITTHPTLTHTHSHSHPLSFLPTLPLSLLPSHSKHLNEIRADSKAIWIPSFQHWGDWTIAEVSYHFTINTSLYSLQ